MMIVVRSQLWLGCGQRQFRFPINQREQLTELLLAVEPEVPRDDDELADQGYPEQRRRDRAP